MKRLLITTLAVIMMVGSVVGIGGFETAYADSPIVVTCEHEYTKSWLLLEPTESKNGVRRYFCKNFCTCGGYYDEYLERLPNVYVNKFRHYEDGLSTRITAHQTYKILDGELNISLGNWNTTLLTSQYNYNWQDSSIKNRAIEFKASDVGVGYFNSNVKSYSLSIPLRAVTECDKDGAVVVYLTTGAAIVRLSEEATAALAKDAEESIGVVVKRNGDEVSAQLTVDGKDVAAPAGVEMLYWVKDAGNTETASEQVLNSYKYSNFKLEGEFDLIFVESLSK